VLSKKLNLGCGSFKMPGYVNVDSTASSQPDLVHDLNLFPYPFEDGWFANVEMNHALEHLEDPFSVMREVERILQPGGELIVRVPHFSRGFTHADHKRGFDITFPLYFQPSFLAGFTGVHFELQSMKLRWYAQPYLKRLVIGRITDVVLRGIGSVLDVCANLFPAACSRIWCYWVGGFEELEMQFCKPDSMSPNVPQ